MAADTAHWETLVDGFMAPYRWIISAEALAAFTPGLERMRERGWRRPFVIAGTVGTGPLPDPDTAETVILDTSAPTMMEGIRAFDRALRRLPREVLDRIDAWDPDHSARYLASFLEAETTLHGRSSWGARPVAWLELEDKTTVHRIWDAAGVPQAPFEIVEEGDDLTAAARRLDQGHGTAWVGDNREGWHGGAEYLRYVADSTDAAEAVAFMTEHAGRVRVMPFLEGVSCSIHGMVFPDHVAAFRPVEMVVFRVPGSTRLRYGGASTTWDPPPDDRAEMRAIARRVGERIRADHGFRGAFTIDGVLTAEGFRPTELNARYGAGLGVQGRALPDLPLLGIHRCLVAGEQADYRPRELEAVVVAAADRTRTLHGVCPLAGHRVETETIGVGVQNGAIVAAGEDDAHGSLMVGPATHGGIVLLRVDPEHSPAGVQAAPIVATAFELADRTWATGIGELIPATPVR